MWGIQKSSVQLAFEKLYHCTVEVGRNLNLLRIIQFYYLEICFHNISSVRTAILNYCDDNMYVSK